MAHMVKAMAQLDTGGVILFGLVRAGTAIVGAGSSSRQDADP